MVFLEIPNVPLRTVFAETVTFSGECHGNDELYTYERLNCHTTAYSGTTDSTGTSSRVICFPQLM